MTETTRANCPLIGVHCEGRRLLLDLQIQMGIDAINTAPNVVADGDSRRVKVAKVLANFASSSATQSVARGLEQFSRAIDEALDAEPAVTCNGSMCGTLGNLVVAYGETFMSDGFKMRILRGE